MTVLQLLRVPHPVLKHKAVKVPKWAIKGKSSSLAQLAVNLVETCAAHNGVGLAANQVGDLRKVAVIWADKEPLVLVNPKIVERAGERIVEEGCLSIPGYMIPVKRAVEITVKGLGLDGKAHTITAKDNFMAQVLEHELDHIQGILCLDRRVGRK